MSFYFSNQTMYFMSSISDLWTIPLLVVIEEKNDIWKNCHVSMNQTIRKHVLFQFVNFYQWFASVRFLLIEYVVFMFCCCWIILFMHKYQTLISFYLIQFYQYKIYLFICFLFLFLFFEIWDSFFVFLQ